MRSRAETLAERTFSYENERIIVRIAARIRGKKKEYGGVWSEGAAKGGEGARKRERREREEVAEEKEEKEEKDRERGKE